MRKYEYRYESPKIQVQNSNIQGTSLGTWDLEFVAWDLEFGFMAEKIKVMIVDDHPVITEGMQLLLSDVATIRVAATASSGREALFLLHKTEVDVVLLDVEMPMMNGIDAAREIKASFPKIKIIALTSYSEKALIQKMISVGASGYVLKNVTKEKIINAIYAVVKGEQHYSDEIAVALAKHDASEILSSHVQQDISKILTGREVITLKLIAQGLTNAEIAGKLFVSPKTVDNHRTNIMRKLDIHNVAGLIRFAFQNKLAE